MKYQELIAQMTPEEKASLCSGADFWNSKAIARLNIPSMMLTDGPHGVRKQAGRTDHLGINNSVPATCFPTAAGLANTWNEQLIERMGEALGAEAAAEGVSVLLGPGVNLKRNPLCGRSFEYFSEDPFLTGKAAAALIRGIQSNGISACVKHFAANSQEKHRMSCDSVLDERTLRELYLPAFEMAVKEGGVKCVMTSYNRVNGVYSNENEHLLKDILRGEWGFDGMVVTDWGGNNDRVAGLIAGNDLEMPGGSGETDRQIAEAVKAGTLDEHLLDERVDAILDRVFSALPNVSGKSYDPEAHHALAVEIAAEAAVLLKNEGGILPLKKGQSAAVIGDFAKTPRYQGAGSSKINPTKLDNLLDCLKNENVSISGFAPGFLRGGGKDSRMIAEAVALAGRSDVVVLCLGLDEGGEAEGLDRVNLSLPENQLALLSAVSDVNPNIVAVLSCGCAVDLRWDEKVKALVHGYLGGQAGAAGMAALLSGRKNPGGKLSETVALCLEDIPSSADYPAPEATAEYREGIYVGYRYFDTAGAAVKYPFGFGLSYTTFAYSDLHADENGVTFCVENTGDAAGAETAQLYIAAHTGGMFRPAKELKGFQKVFLQPGEKCELHIPLTERSFAVWSVAENGWVTEPGTYELLIGASSSDIRLRTAVEKTGAPTTDPYQSELFRPYRTADVKQVPDDSFRALLMRPIPAHDWDREGKVDITDPIERGRVLRGGLGKTLYRAVALVRSSRLRRGEKEKANNVMFVMDMPYRGLSRMTGKFSEAQVKALVKVINREKGGLRELLKAERVKRG